MPRKKFNPDATDPKYRGFLAEMTGMAEVGDWLTLAGYNGNKLYALRTEIIKNCETVIVQDKGTRSDNHLISSQDIMAYLKNMKKEKDV